MIDLGLIRAVLIIFVCGYISLKMVAWVNRDAGKKRLRTQAFWTTAALFFNIFGFLAYLACRNTKGPIKCDYCGYDLTKVLSETNLFTCPHCNKLIHSDVAHQIFLDKVKNFDTRIIKLFDYEGLDIEQGAGKDSKSRVWSIVKFYIARAIDERATDIHFDPEKEKVRVRQRIDGVLYDVIAPPRELGVRVTAMLKILAGLDIAQKKEAQSGRFEVEVEGKRYDLRISTSYAIFGEKIAIRILRRDGILLSLENLGFFKDDLSRIEQVVSKPHGMILICGPTGCGKTTTLYSIIKKVNPEKHNIMTIEDPVEYELPGISQQQINVKAGVDFVKGLRSMLRQDPDVIMVGEIRDGETAKIANQAADTGHLVLSTMHSIDAANAITRLRDFEITPHHLSSSLLAIIAQRLIRILCPDCKEKADCDTAMEEGVKNVYKAKGCSKCNYTGYRGRTGLFEILFADKELRELIFSDAAPDVIRENYAKWGMRDLRGQGLRKVEAGETTLEELNAVVPATKFFTKRKIQ